MRRVIFMFFSPNEQRTVGGSRGDALPNVFFFFFFFYPYSADHERGWPPCKKVVFQVGNQYAGCKKQQKV